jgi:secretion/DNA translocation related CpaE-like protein
MQVLPNDERQRPLVVTGDPDLLDELLRLASAVGVDVTVAVDAVGAVADWAGSPMILVGADLAADLCRLRLPRRMGVIVVSGGPVPPWSAAATLAVEHVVVLPDAATWLTGRLTQQGWVEDRAGQVVAVIGGSGGAGASLFANALAMAGREHGLDTLLVDGDPLGGGVLSGDGVRVPGEEPMSWLRWTDLVDDDRGGVPVLPPTASGRGSLAVLSFDRHQFMTPPPEAMAAAIDAGRRSRDLVVLDLPRFLDRTGQLALTSADRGYLLVLAEIRACAAATRVHRRWGRRWTCR